MSDILENKITNIPVLNDGFIRLVDIMPRVLLQNQTCDSAITRAARVSYGNIDTKSTPRGDRELIRYLFRNKHTSPFEMIEFTFHWKLPLFVARQVVRHRTASLNEISARYTQLQDTFYRPSSIYFQSKDNKQGSGELITDPDIINKFYAYLDKSESLYTDYKELIDLGVSRELARIGLPVSIYTEWYWKIDLHNLLHFIKLRSDMHAQKEVRDYANAIFDIIKQFVPYTCEAFDDYEVGSIKLHKCDINAIKQNDTSHITNKRELGEFLDKKDKIFDN
jgi:thymidylate synthase (FAD)